MNVIAPRTLRVFWKKHAQAEVPLREWMREVRRANYANFAELRAGHSEADFVTESELTIFNIGGNKYRLTTFVRYTSQTVFIKRVMTHAEYDRWNARGKPL